MEVLLHHGDSHIVFAVRALGADTWAREGS